MSPTPRTVALLALCGISALWLPAAAAALALAVVAGAALADAWMIRRPPAVERRVPAEVVRGQPVDLVVRVDPAALPRGITVRVRQPQLAEVRITPSEADGELRATLVATHRGGHDLAPVVTATTGPLGLARWVHRHGDPTTVTSHVDLPGARRLAAAVRAGNFRDPGLRRGPIGLGTDFEAVREYTPDDDVRRINWAATERTQRPMVNTYREDTERDLWCLIDTGRLLASPIGDRTRLDLVLDAVASVGAVADVLGDRVGAVVFDEKVREVIRPRRANLSRLARRLDLLQPAISDSDYEAAFARVTAEKRALVIVFTDLLDAAAAAPLLDAMPVLVRRHAVLVAGLADPDLISAATDAPTSPRDVHVATVANDLLTDRDQVRDRLAAAGAVVVDATEDRLSSACVAAYLRLKANARL